MWSVFHFHVSTLSYGPLLLYSGIRNIFISRQQKSVPTILSAKRTVGIIAFHTCTHFTKLHYFFTICPKNYWILTKKRRYSVVTQWLLLCVCALLKVASSCSNHINALKWLYTSNFLLLFSFLIPYTKPNCKLLH